MELINKTALCLYFCGYEKCVSSHSFGPAVRPHYLIHYVLSGQGSYYENGKEHKLKAGDGFLITPGKITYYIADSDNPWEYCWFGFDGYEAKNILEQCGLSETNLVFHSELDSLSATLLELIQVFSDGSGNVYSYISYLYRIFSFLILMPKSITSPIAEDYMKQALAYIHQNYIYDIKIYDVAKSIGIDRTYLYRLFMDSKKISPQQYLIHHRLQVVCRHLLETNLTVTQIAYSCGFKDSPSLNKHFKKRYHITPQQYRKTKGTSHYIVE